MSKVDDLIRYGTAEIGKPYVYGDEGPNTFDCSGLMQFVFAKVGIKLPRTSQEQQRIASPVSGSPRSGDLVFWGSPAYHVGLYLGGGRVLAAPQPGEKVKVQDVWGSPTYGRISGLGAGSGGGFDPIGWTTQPVSMAGDVAQAVVDAVITPLGDIAAVATVAVLGIALVGLGAWQATKGGSSNAGS